MASVGDVLDRVSPPRVSDKSGGEPTRRQDLCVSGGVPADRRGGNDSGTFALSNCLTFFNAQTDATSFGQAFDTAQFDSRLTIEDLPDIEQDLETEEAARMLFLVVDDLPSSVLQKCIVKLSAGDDSKLARDSFSEWAHKSGTEQAPVTRWKCMFLEGLALIGRADVLMTLGFNKQQIIQLEQSLHLSSMKVRLNTVCCALVQEELKRLVDFIQRSYLRNSEAVRFPNGRVIKQLLELYLLYWMQENLMDYSDMSKLAQGLREIDRADLIPELGAQPAVVAPPVYQHQVSLAQPSPDRPNVLISASEFSEISEELTTHSDMSKLAQGLREIDRADLIPELGAQPAVVAPPVYQHQVSLAQPSPGRPNVLISASEFSEISEELTTHSETLQPYKRYGNDRGLCIIFNQESFTCQTEHCPLMKKHNHGFRYGSSIDAENLAAVFGGFNCRTHIIQNRTRQEMLDVLAGLSTANDLKNFNYLILCFLSHGNLDEVGRQFIYASDCQPLLVKALAAHFGSDRCSPLAGSLKLVITQACQGTGILNPISAEVDGISPQSNSTAESDFLFLQATTPGYQAFRDPLHGSFYIQCLCRVLRERGHMQEISQCVKQAHFQVVQFHIFLAEEQRYCKMQPQMVDRTNGHFVFKKSVENQQQ